MPQKEILRILDHLRRDVRELRGDEIFFAPPRIYILGSKRSIVKNLGACFRHHFSAPRVGQEGHGFAETFRG